MSLDIVQPKMDFMTLVCAAQILDDKSRLKAALDAGKQKASEIGRVLDAMPGLRREKNG